MNPLVLSTVLAASAWQHAHLKSTTGYEISVDYEVQTFDEGYPEIFTYATPVWVNVWRDGTPLSDSDHVRVLLMPWTVGEAKDGPAPAYQPGGAQTLDLSYAGAGHFTAQAQQLYLYGADAAGGRGYLTKIAVVADGAWQTDSADGKADFLVDLNQTGPSAPAGCQAFIEKASASGEAHHIEMLHFYLKTHLPSPPKRVAFHGEKKESSPDLSPAEGWTDADINPFLDAKDFYEFDLPVTAHNDSGISVDYVRGEFFVVTATGETLWIKPGDGSDFVFNEDFFTNLTDAMQNAGIQGAQYDDDYGRDVYTTVSPDAALWTKYSFQYLNPSHCD